MSDDFATAIESLIRKAPSEWLTLTCEMLRGSPVATTAESILQRLPSTNNADLSFVMAEVVRLAEGKMTWEALSWCLQTTFTVYHHWQVEQHIELLWAGPSPNDQIPVRRIDQSLYDLIANAKREILLVTFAASRIERLTSELLKATHRGVMIRLILEFEESSEGQLSYDALKAFPSALIATAEVYYWPVEKRERNQAGRPGKLHAKIAIIDDIALISSANLTDDAFNRNLEIGAMVKNVEFVESSKKHINSLIARGIFGRIRSQR